MIRLTVIIPNYTGGRTIERCIDGVYSQKTKIEEIIVVDDGSTDNSVELIRHKYPEIHIVRHKKNEGASKARNDGIKNSSGDLLLFVDSDVFLSEFCTKELLKSIDEFDIVYPTVLFENGEILSPASSNEKTYIRRSPAFLIKREALNKLDELFDENYFIYYEDIDFFMRCYLAGLKSKYVDTAVAYHSILESQNRNLERRYYLETKNQIYCMIKFSKIPKEARKLFLIPSIETILSRVRVAISNKNIYSNYPDHASADRLSNSRIKLIYILLKAIFWNILKLRDCLIKRKIIAKNVGGNKAHKGNR